MSIGHYQFSQKIANKIKLFKHFVHFGWLQYPSVSCSVHVFNLLKIVKQFTIIFCFLSSWSYLQNRQNQISLKFPLNINFIFIILPHLRHEISKSLKISLYVMSFVSASLLGELLVHHLMWFQKWHRFVASPYN